MIAQKRGGENHSISGAFVFLLLGLFAVLALLVMLTGVKAYSTLTDRVTENSDGRLLISYTASKIRMSDTAGAISVRQDGDMDVLVITQSVDGGLLDTLIYCADGYLCEQLVLQGEPTSPTYAERIARADSFSAEIEDGLLCYTILRGDAVYSAHVALRCF